MPFSSPELHNPQPHQRISLLWANYIHRFAKEHARPAHNGQAVWCELANLAHEAFVTAKRPKRAEKIHAIKSFLLDAARHEHIHPLAHRKFGQIIEYMGAVALNQPTHDLRKLLYQNDADSLVHIAMELQSRRRRQKGELDSISLTGRATELIFSTLINSRLHPNLVAIPSLPFQDASKDREFNHDYLFIDNYRNDHAIVLPVQIKSNFWRAHHTSYDQYDSSVGVVIGSEDLHECRVTGNEACYSTACFVQEGLRRALASRSSGNQQRITEVLADRLLLKLSSWPDHAKEWGTTHDYIAYVQGLLARSALRRRVPRQAASPKEENLLVVSRFSSGAGGETRTLTS